MDNRPGDTFGPPNQLLADALRPPFSKLFNRLDELTRHHSRRVQTLALRLGHALQIDANELPSFATAALFHDLGKIDISGEILFKRNHLSAAERDRIQQHPEIGARIWLEAGGYYRISEAILSHHENFNGSGYPFGLRGTQIPLWGRIISIADALDVMIAGRHYSQPGNITNAIERLRAASGVQFDPELVDKITAFFKKIGWPALGAAIWRRAS